MKLQVIHDTSYSYSPLVETAKHQAHLRPLTTQGQQLLSHTLNIEPAPTQRSESSDVFGNHRCLFSLERPHHGLKVTASSVVSTVSAGEPASQIPWETARAQLTYRRGQAFDPATEFVFPSLFCPRHHAFVDYARPSFSPGAGVLKAAQHLMQRMHTEFTYESQSTQINTPALQALAQRKGVCQDFAHIMIACLRSLGLGARYVSGYLLTEPAPGTPRLLGCDASHAWVAIYVPDLPVGLRWCHLDPTNNRAGWHAPSADYVVLASGRDFADVSPTRGVIHGGANHTLTVGVTVLPLAEP